MKMSNQIQKTGSINSYFLTENSIDWLNKENTSAKEKSRKFFKSIFNTFKYFFGINKKSSNSVSSNKNLAWTSTFHF
jgi:hypothetical protein